MVNDALTVSQFVETVNVAMDVFQGIVVQGEVNDYKLIHNKWVTFQIRDEESSVGCFMPMWDLKVPLEDGMLVKVQGQPKLRNKGFFSFSLTHVVPAGEGSLKRAFELLQKKLTGEGLFDEARKRELPRFPQHVALITSEQAAAYTDFLKILKARYGGLNISFLPVQVQGEPSPGQILRALEYANTDLENLDVIVLVRGGGSLEDLHAFNDEAVVRAVAASRTPTIVGIGHERDVSLAEMAADVRASTPSNAAELLVAGREEIALSLQNMSQKLSSQMNMTLQSKRDLISRAGGYLSKEVMQEINIRKDKLGQITRLLSGLSPESTLARGFSITRHEDGKIVSKKRPVKAGETVETQLAGDSFKSVVS